MKNKQRQKDVSFNQSIDNTIKVLKVQRKRYLREVANVDLKLTDDFKDDFFVI